MNWQTRMKEQIKTVDGFKDDLNLTEEEVKTLEKISERHPLSTTRYYYDLIDKNDPNDPIRKLAIPNDAELDDHGQYDTSGEGSNTKMTGLQHKYQSTALVLSTNVCFMYCRYCFRKRMVGYTRDEINERMKETVEYVKNNPQINNVLISGGDSFTLRNEEIENYLENLTPIEHLDFIRFGTRIPVVFPYRITEDPALLNILKTYNQKKQIVIVTQFNHPRELTSEAIKGIKALMDAGCVVRNQMVLLSGVNDDIDTLVTLIRGLTKTGIQPYYTFQCRPVKFATGYQVTLSKGLDILKEARKQLNGVAKGFRYMMSHPLGKIEIFGKTDSDFIFKFHHAKHEAYNETLFMKPLDEKATWLDDDLNPMH